MSEELNPCPFCGGEPEMIHAVLEEYHSVNPELICRECGYRIKAKNLAIVIADSPKENCKFLDRQTIRIWNTRPVEDTLEKEVERLKAENEKLKNKLVLVKKHVVDNRDALLFVLKSEHNNATYCEFAFCQSLLELINADTGKVGGDNETA